MARLRELTAQIRTVERTAKALEKASTADAKQQKQLYAEAQQARVDADNESLEEKVTSLKEILAATLQVDDYIDFESLKDKPTIMPFSPGSLAQGEPTPQLEPSLPTAPSGLGKLFPGARAKYEKELARSREEHESAQQTALQEWASREESRKRDVASSAAQHAEIDALRTQFEAGEPTALVSYFTRVLEASQYPDGFPHHTKMAFVPESKQLVVEFELPPLDTVPTTKIYKYVKARDEINVTPLPETQRKTLYSSVISQVTIRTVHELFEADRGGMIETIVFNGYVNSIDRRTGEQVSPYLVTLRTTRDAFERLDLARVDPAECLRGLHASVSKSPAELAPVRPVLDFNMVDDRFVEESDVLSGLDTRPNLMELSPSEFEALITNLFERMGLETRMTRPSRDGGVDCVAFDQRPIFGGKVVIQAKRYKNTVGVSAVRDLFGTVMNEGASKGILVATSGYGKASFDFASNKPLELLDGSNLLFLLREHVGIEARIEVPDDWVDPLPES